MTGNRDREKKKRGPWEREGKKRVSFVFRNQFFILLCFSPNRPMFFFFFSPILLLSLSPLPSSAWALRLGLGKRRHGIFPQFYGSRPNPTPTHFSVSPSTPSTPCQEGVLRKTIHTPLRILHVCGCVCCAKQYVAMVTNDIKKTYSI